jgi:hypothetical protein
MDWSPGISPSSADDPDSALLSTYASFFTSVHPIGRKQARRMMNVDGARRRPSVRLQIVMVASLLTGERILQERRMGTFLRPVVIFSPVPFRTALEGQGKLSGNPDRRGVSAR